MPAENEPYKPKIRPGRADREERCANCGSKLFIAEIIPDEQLDMVPKDRIKTIINCPGCETTVHQVGGSRWPSLSPEEAKARRRRSAIRSYNDHWRIKEEKSGF